MANGTSEMASSKQSALEEYYDPIITHVFLVVGILFFNWSVVEVVFLYFIEVAVIHVLFVTVALFAAQPIEGHDGDKWANEPAPITLISVVPPIYSRNISLVGKYLVFGFMYILPFIYAIVQVAERSLSSLVSPALGLAILAIVISQLARVWRQFIAEQAYQERSPAEAIRVGLRPLHELIVIVLFVFVPITFIVVAAAFAVGDIESQTLVLLAYVIPIGAARVWLQNDNLSVRLQYEK